MVILPGQFLRGHGGGLFHPHRQLFLAAHHLHRTAQPVFAAEQGVAVADGLHHRKAPFHDGRLDELVKEGGVVHRAPPHPGGARR